MTEEVTKAFVREFIMLEFFRTLPDRRMCVAVKYSDLAEVEKYATALYENDAYFRACVDTTVSAARRVFDRFAPTGPSGE